MKTIKLICSILFLIVVASSCSEIQGIDQDLSFLNSVNSAKLDKIFVISDDNSGNVKITPVGEGVTTYTVQYGHGTGAASSAVVLPGNSTTYSYPEGNYTVTIVATDLAGKNTTTTYPLTVTYRAPEDVLIKIESDMVVSATALYAKSFLVYYGDVTNEVGTPMAIGEKLPAHVYPDGGPFSLKVVALSGGVATTEVVKPLLGCPITFEEQGIDFYFGTFGANQGFEVIANPDANGINTSANVAKLTRGYEAWSGIYGPLNVPVNFVYGKKIKVWAYNPNAALVGKKLNIELESAVGGLPANGACILKVAFTKSGEWEELVADFSSNPAITPTTRFNQLVFRFNDTSLGGGAIIYIDNIRFTN